MSFPGRWNLPNRKNVIPAKAGIQQAVKHENHMYNHHSQPAKQYTDASSDLIRQVWKHRLIASTCYSIHQLVYAIPNAKILDSRLRGNDVPSMRNDI